MSTEMCFRTATRLGDLFYGAIVSSEQIRQEAVNGNSASLQTKDREAVEAPLPLSMHAGQIIMLTKMLTATDLSFYGFEDGAPVHRWRSGPSGSS